MNHEIEFKTKYKIVDGKFVFLCGEIVNGNVVTLANKYKDHVRNAFALSEKYSIKDGEFEQE